MAPFGGVGYVSGKFWQLGFGLVRRGAERFVWVGSGSYGEFG